MSQGPGAGARRRPESQVLSAIKQCKTVLLLLHFYIPSPVRLRLVSRESAEALRPKKGVLLYQKPGCLTFKISTVRVVVFLDGPVLKGQSNIRAQFRAACSGWEKEGTGPTGRGINRSRMAKSTLPSDSSSRGGRARGNGRDIRGFEHVKRQVHEMEVYLETNLSDPYGEVRSGRSGRTSD